MHFSIELIIVRSPSLSAMNSASVVLRAVSVCIFYAHVSLQLEYFIMYPVLDFAVYLSAPFGFPISTEICIAQKF